MMNSLLYLFGYRRVPKEALMLVVAVREKWKKDTKDADIGRGLEVLEKLMRSAQ